MVPWLSYLLHIGGSNHKKLADVIEWKATFDISAASSSKLQQAHADIKENTEFSLGTAARTV